MQRLIRLAFILMLLCWCSPELRAQRGLTEVPDTNPAMEKASFQVADGFEVNLFASDPMIAKPIQMNWDSKGRLWVATSETYPHVKPGEKANDKVMILEDTDGDGVVDRSTEFADRLLIPTAILPGDGGVYVANSTELLHLKDTDGDGKADERRIILSGFGTEDTHHIIHTLKRGPDGWIYFNQSIYTHSHVETPHGVRRLLAGGTWRFNPYTMELEVYTRGLVNPWGLVFDKWGQSFETDGAGGEGVHYVFPDVVMFTAYNAERIVHGLNPGQPKHCGLEILSGNHLPAGWDGRFVTNDFRGNRINSFELSPSGSGYVSVQKDHLLVSNYVSFRPVDILMGPDGAIYVADWYNPIIQHGEVDFRDDRRDHEHGRIWRIAPQGLQKVDRKLPADCSNQELVDLLKSDQKWWRDQARSELQQRLESERKISGGNVDQQITNLLMGEMAKIKHPKLEWNDDNWFELTYEQFELARTFAPFKDAQTTPFWSLSFVKQPEMQAAYLRLLGDYLHLPRWEDAKYQNGNPVELAALSAIKSEHPQVRLEAVHLLRKIGTLDALKAAASAISAENDRFLEFALWHTFRESEGIWLPKFKEDPAWFSEDPQQLLTLANAARSGEVVLPILKMWQAGRIAATQTPQVLQLIADRGDAQAIDQLWTMSQTAEAAQRHAILDKLVETADRRKVAPASNLAGVQNLLQDQDTHVRLRGCQLCGLWGQQQTRPALTALAENEADPLNLRAEALYSLARLGGAESRDYLKSIAQGEQKPLLNLQVTAIDALSLFQMKIAADSAVLALTKLEEAGKVNELLNPILNRKQGPGLLIQSLKDQKLSPEVATVAIRRASSLPQPNPALLDAIRQAGGLSAVSQEMSAEEMQQLVTEITQQGNIQRGEEIYRREKLQCLNCHAVGGAGGKVGPDLSSIGASAPVDYLVDSLINPNKKIKEGYHTIQVVTVDGLVVTGVAVLENQQEIHLRDAEGKIKVIASEDIELKKNSPVSLMPADLVSKLRRDELVDLVRFISSLGKTGENVVSKQQLVRTWQVLNPGDQIRAVNDAIRHNGVEYAATDDPVLVWKTGYSHVDGSLHLGDLVWMGNIAGTSLQFARTNLDVIQAGKIGLRIEDPTGLRMWWDGQELKVGQEITWEAQTTGQHRLTIASDSQARSMKPIRIEIIDAGGTGQVTTVN
ncbi:MAG: HEAT repeat domain-containing protein [Planctomycetaceae bacterium]|nr:HEAT repeat domain-containing protein [Planctomycetaceae bacterium]